MENTVKFDENKLRAISAWKKSYIQTVIETLQPHGNVLEFGFSLGHAAEVIQTHQPKTHTIIESDPLFIQEAKKWSAKHPNTSVIGEKWQNALPKLGVFDVIFYNDHTLEQDMELANYLFPEETTKVTANAKELLKRLNEHMAALKTTFSDDEINEFYQKISQADFKELPSFFRKLKDNENISNKQYEQVIKKFHLEKNKPEKSNAEPDDMFLCLQECLKSHMGSGACFSCFLSKPASKYEDFHFFENVITNPKIDYTEKLITIKPENGNGNSREALIIIVKKHA